MIVIDDILGERVAWRGGLPRYWSRGKTVCWGPKAVEIHDKRREARKAARRYRRGS